jgi:hypothetical protein
MRMRLLPLPDELRQLAFGSGLFQMHQRQFHRLVHHRKAKLPYADGIIATTNRGFA